MSRNLSLLNLRNYELPQTAIAVGIATPPQMPPKSVLYTIPWSIYGASDPTSQIAVKINMVAQGQATTQGLLDRIRSVYVDNTFSDATVYVQFTDTLHTIYCQPNSAGWYPCLTNGFEFIVYGEGFITGNIPTTTLNVTNIDRQGVISPPLIDIPPISAPRAFYVDPPLLGLGYWDLDLDGPATFTPGVYTITPDVGFAANVKLWGPGGSSGARAIPVSSGSVGNDTSFASLLAGAGMPTAGSLLPRATFIVSAGNSNQTSIAIPAAAQAGDFCIATNFVVGAAAATVPAGFQILNDYTTGTAVVSYGILTPAQIAAGTLTGFTAGFLEYLGIYIIRPNGTAVSAAIFSVNNELTTGNPILQTINVAGNVPPLFMLAHSFANSAPPNMTIVPNDFTKPPAFAPAYAAAYRLVDGGATAVNHTVDVPDSGGGSDFLGTCYIELKIGNNGAGGTGGLASGGNFANTDGVAGTAAPSAIGGQASGGTPTNPGGSGTDANTGSLPGGGASGSFTNGRNQAGGVGGGGGGGYVEHDFALTDLSPGIPITLTVGTPGAAGTGTIPPGIDGALGGIGSALFT